jgi:hypothetical protein
LNFDLLDIDGAVFLGLQAAQAPPAARRKGFPVFVEYDLALKTRETQMNRTYSRENHQTMVVLPYV